MFLAPVAGESVGEVFPAQVRGGQSLLVPTWSQTWPIFNPHLSQNKQYKEKHFMVTWKD